MGDRPFGIDYDTVRSFAEEIRDVKGLGVEIGIVIGGGNILRGAALERGGIDRVTGDYMGMLSTLINGLIFQDYLEKMGLLVKVFSGLNVEGVVEPFSRRATIRHLQNKGVAIFACGTGNPYFTTDTAAALRALEIEAEVLIKATKVKGVYDRDPVIHKDAIFYNELTYTEVIEKDLKVMDIAAISLCKDNALPIIVFDIKERGNLQRVIKGEYEGTIIKEAT